MTVVRLLVKNLELKKIMRKNMTNRKWTQSLEVFDQER